MLYKVGNRSVLNWKNDSRYGLGQCTRDINRTECRNCLSELMGIIDTKCKTKTGFNIYAPSCTLRFEVLFH